MRGVAVRNESVVCPKPRRLTRLTAGVDQVRPFRWHACTQVELFCEPKAGTELLDIFLTKGGEASQAASSPPFFCGSPPSRASNPLVHDARFGEEKPVGPSLLPHAIIPSGSPVGPATSASRKGCGPTKFGLKPAATRVEGFDCLDRDRRGCGITAIA
ncbi:hypothetical protein COCNU_06G009290 [Cocos nucifera]|uniref:Uncharacterized protein n=1 Tax=Cocos nucifera TaxID=13894 RepID=A0A8K0IBT4_COCNU|nr:hypothetical protein COCNU_06G009290 [Cocos nucifera]